MKLYQKQLFDIFADYRQKPTWSVYPPYHQGDYLEEYFYKYYEQNSLETGRYFIPAGWSACYINSKDAPQRELQKKLNDLDSTKNYFTVSTHDDAPRERLPPNTIRFSAGGNAGDIAIPLIVSKIPPALSKNCHNKEYFASFVGSMTHPVRRNMLSNFVNNKDFIFDVQGWSPSISQQKLDKFLETTKKSKFALAPRGYGKTSYRLYEIMQLGTVPVYITDEEWLPWEDELVWDEFCVRINTNQIPMLDMILKQFSEAECDEMIENAKIIYDDWFTIESVTNRILKRVK
jgi:hypothetical protein